jgi:hypothetical protein
MSVLVQPVAPQFVAQLWPQVEPFIAKAEKHGGGDYNMDQIRMYLNMGMWWLVVVTKGEELVGAVTGTFISYPNDRVAFITTTGGEELCNDDALAQLKQILKAQGATKIQAACRESMVRLLQKIGFSPRYVVVETGI